MDATPTGIDESTLNELYQYDQMIRSKIQELDRICESRIFIEK